MARDDRELVVACRPSALARWQAESIRKALVREWPGLSVRIRTIASEGDRRWDRPLPEIGGQGLFTSALQEAIREGSADLAVHSLKDLPIEEPPDLYVAAILAREDPRDVLVSAHGTRFEDLPEGAVVGTSSLRRQAQILAIRPDLHIEPIRGNVETRVRKVREEKYDAAVMAAAGLLRLGLEEEIGDWFSLDQVLPAPGQGALALECRSQDGELRELLMPLDAESVRAAVTAERAFLTALGGGCSAPVGAFAEISGEGSLAMKAVVAQPDGSRLLRAEGRGSDPIKLGKTLASQVIRRGAHEVLLDV